MIAVSLCNPNFLSNVTMVPDCLDESWHLPFGSVYLTGHFRISGLRMKISLTGENEGLD